MVPIRHMLFWLAVAMFVFWMTGCTASTDPQNSGPDLTEVESMLKVTFPADAKIIYSEKADRSNQAAHFITIHTAAPVRFEASEGLKLSPDTAIKKLSTLVKAKSLGELKNKWTYNYEGHLENGSWKAYQTTFDSGSYLEVQLYFF